MERKLRLYDIVKPSAQWIKNHFQDPMCLPICGFEDSKEEMLFYSTGFFFFLSSVGYIDKIEGGRYAVKWLTKSQNGTHIVHSAWWLDGELEVIGNAATICKDLILI